MIKLIDIGLVENEGVLFNNIELTIEKGIWINLIDLSVTQYKALFRMLEGRIMPLKGVYLIEGVNVKEFSMLQRASLRKREVLNLAESSFLIMEKTVIDNLRWQLKASGIYPTKWKSIIEERLNELSLQHIKNIKCCELNKFDLAKTKLAKALVSRPRLILLEENLLKHKDKEEEQRVLNIITNSVLGKDISVLTANYNNNSYVTIIKNIKF
ncbi:ATP-binding cassette domain-containing protein [Alkaliphilus peptidifermentans]|uniref:ABC-type lipoprotein export system, ATPase component n=1 Tax=Alkaliphilus peptidifermentans DSM 18978 TaxID=1120976 RepID=A0A1G5IE57_9FIRM|nr:hypothetical protein [Alkaliphilus peptidifermentans]SCY74051.1 ABC-type lipoprotein export system, ATPase component [Alkaliphilus peptidifermentans DSM 18978]